MSTFVISTAEAKQDKLFYVVANIIIIDSKSHTCLLLKRGENEKVLPGKWGHAGGKLEHGDVKRLILEVGSEPIEGIDNILGKLAKREAKEECGLDIQEESNVLKNKVFVRPDGIPVFMATMVSEYKGGEVLIEAGAIADYAWVSVDKLDDYDTIKGVAEEVKLALAQN
jgi:8-oxo-dGTP pyrophosphatase MutT (NUDIX family)